METNSKMKIKQKGQSLVEYLIVYSISLMLCGYVFDKLATYAPMFYQGLVTKLGM